MPDGDALAMALAAKYAETGSYRKLAAALSLEPRRWAPLLCKALRGEPVSASTERRIARALGLAKPPRRLHRVVMGEAEFAAWRSLSKEERLRRLTNTGANNGD